MGKETNDAHVVGFVEIYREKVVVVGIEVLQVGLFQGE